MGFGWRPYVFIWERRGLRNPSYLEQIYLAR